MIAANEPANITGTNSSRVKITTCGPMIAVNTPPAKTKEMARALNSGGALSAAAKRNCCTKAPPRPKDQQAAAEQPEARLEQREPSRRSRPARLPDCPIMKPLRWPSMRISAAAGTRAERHADGEAGNRRGGQRLVRAEQVIAGQRADRDRDRGGRADDRLGRRKDQRGAPRLRSAGVRGHRRSWPRPSPRIARDAVEHGIDQFRLVFE